MQKLLLILFIFLGSQLCAQNYCDSIEISMNLPSNSFPEFSVNLSNIGASGTTYNWELLDESGTLVNSSLAAIAIFSLPNNLNSDTNIICLTSTFSVSGMTFACNTCDTIVWDGAGWVLLSMIPPPCNLTGGSVYVDPLMTPVMMNATVNGMSQYTYVWSDGSTANQTQYYQNWCVTITDVMSGCDTAICENCVAIPNPNCICPSIYMPVCGCDGVMYSNYCFAECVQVGWIPAISNGMPGGFLPCTSSCGVELTGDSILCSWGDPQILTASPNSSTVLPAAYAWNTGQTGPVLTISTPGYYCVTLTDANGCMSTECITVSVQNIPIYSAPSPPIICLGDSIVLEIDTVGLSNIVWVPTASINTINRVLDYPVNSTIYVVEAIDSAGCDMRGEIEVIVDTCATGVMDIILDQVIIYPNPANGIMTISLPESEIFDLELYDMTGRLVSSANKVSQKYIIYDKFLEDGIYVLKLRHAKGVIAKKIIFK